MMVSVIVKKKILTKMVISNDLFPNLLYIRHGSYSPSVAPDFNADDMEAIDDGDNNHNNYNFLIIIVTIIINNYNLARRQCEVEPRLIKGRIILVIAIVNLTPEG